MIWEHNVSYCAKIILLHKSFFSFFSILKYLLFYSEFVKQGFYSASYYDIIANPFCPW